MENCYLYVLRYNYSNNYYVGSTTKNLNKRMEVHLKENHKQGTPYWSCENNSSEGFKYFWFCIDEKDSSQKNTVYPESELQKIGDHCENTFIKELSAEIEKFADNKSDRKIYILGGDSVKPPYPEVEPIKTSATGENEIHEKIHSYLTGIIKHKLETKIGEYYITYLDPELVQR